MASPEVAFLELYWELLNRKTGDVGRVQFEPQKPLFDSLPEGKDPLPRSTPEEQGIESSYLAQFIDAMARNKKIHLHQIMVVRHGHIIAEAAVSPYKTGMWHSTFSMCKSFTGMAIGILMDEGKIHLEDSVLELLDIEGKKQGNQITRNISRLSHARTKNKFGDLTVRDLLIMSSGASLNEIGAISGNDWVKAYFDSSCKFEPGSKFEYNSMNSFILSAIVSKITGESMFEFLKERLFDPMGITKVFWEHSPEGITKGGWGMFLREEDAAKLGLLYLQGGIYGGKRYISKEWVQEATTPQIETGRKDNPWYGYQCWMGSLPGSFIYSGMLGQNVFAYPTLDLLIVTNAGNTEVFADGELSRTVRHFFCEGYAPSYGAIEPDPAGMDMLHNVIRQYGAQEKRTSRPLHGGWKTKKVHNGKCSSYAKYRIWEQVPRPERNTFADEFPSSNVMKKLKSYHNKTYEMGSKSVGLFPMVLQIVHNNYTNGITELSFSWEQEKLFIHFLEGDFVYTLPVEFGGRSYSIVNLCGEEYEIGTTGRAAYNEDGILVLTVMISFIEEACEREVKIYFLGDGSLKLNWRETPGDQIAQGVLDMLTGESINGKSLFNGALKRINPELIAELTRSVMQPVVMAQEKENENENGILDS